MTEMTTTHVAGKAHRGARTALAAINITRTGLMRAGIARTAASATLGGAMLLVGGCLGLREGGNQISDDSATYISTAWQPKTVQLVDTRTGEVVWSVDIPVGQQLSYDIDPGDDPTSEFPDTLRWSLFDEPTTIGRLRNEIRVPGPGARRVDMTLRDGPEFPQ